MQFGGSWGRPEKGGAVKIEVDGEGEMPHNLISSLQTNTTLCRQAAGSTKQVL
jgi:hypothetical protein